MFAKGLLSWVNIFCWHRKAFVDVNPWEVNKALELNDEEWLGHKLCVRIDGEENSEPKKMEQNENG